MLRAGPLKDEEGAAFVARQIRLLCFAYGLDGRQLAERIGEHPSNVSRALNGRIGRRPSVLRRLKGIGLRGPEDLPEKVCQRA